VADYRYTEYFEHEVLRKRPYLKEERVVHRGSGESNPKWDAGGQSDAILGRNPGDAGALPPSGYTGRWDDDPQCVPGPAVQAMKLNYYPDTDSLYIDLAQRPSAESREVSDGVVLDYDAEGNLVGIDIDNASKKVEMGQVSVSQIPVEKLAS
jgi:uncharacterized protein YuzE